MLKLATVFSGIGAVEHALERMDVKYEIVFASDIGDVDILSKKIKPTTEDIEENFRELEKILKNIIVSNSFNKQKKEAQKKLHSLKKEYKDYIEDLFIDDSKRAKTIRNYSERLAMIYELIATLKIRNDLERISDYKEKKAYVDNLYKSHISQNRVRTSYFANYQIDDERFHWNVSFIDGKQYRNKVDLFVGGSPCQSFSLVGKQRGLEDTRGTLFYEYARLISEIRPKVFIYENVKAVLSNDSGRTWKVMQKVFDDLGYVWKHQILNAKDYGIPQNRERLFVVGFRKDITLTEPFDFPEPVELTTVMQDYLLENASGKYYLPKKGVDFVLDEKNLTKRYTQVDGKVQLCQKKESAI